MEATKAKRKVPEKKPSIFVFGPFRNPQAFLKIFQYSYNFHYSKYFPFFVKDILLFIIQNHMEICNSLKVDYGGDCFHGFWILVSGIWILVSSF